MRSPILWGAFHPPNPTTKLADLVGCIPSTKPHHQTNPFMGTHQPKASAIVDLAVRSLASSAGYSFGNLAITPKERLGIQAKLAIGELSAISDLAVRSRVEAMQGRSARKRGNRFRKGRSWDWGTGRGDRGLEASRWRLRCWIWSCDRT